MPTPTDTPSATPETHTEDLPAFYTDLSLEKQRLVLLYWTYEYPEKDTVSDDELSTIVDEALNQHTPDEIEAIATAGRNDLDT